MEMKIIVRVQRRLVENAKRYASAHNTTLDELISAYLRRIPTGDETLDNAPIVRQLTGLLSEDINAAGPPTLARLPRGGRKS